MIDSFSVRTDLALEAAEYAGKEARRLNGVRILEEEDLEREVFTTIVKIETENSAKVLGKPVGTYITMEVPDMASEDEDYHRDISVCVAEKIRGLLPEGAQDVMIVGLGNRNVTPDALGPFVVENLNITRHLQKEYGCSYLPGEGTVSALVPGVMAQTGMETLEIIQGVTEQTRPDVVLVIDALAARSTRRLNRTIQICDTGIQPGSGVGNHRSGINEKTLGIPVIALGVPTVVDAATIAWDTIEQMNLAGEQQQEMRERMSPGLNTMFVTPKDIDETVKRVSYTISEGLNLAFSSAENGGGTEGRK